MAQVDASISLSQERIRAFVYSEFELNLSISSSDRDPYWAEAVYEVPSPLSLAPDKALQSAKSLVGILQNSETRQKRVKIYAGNETYPEIYKIKITIFLYDNDGAISERKEYVKEIECADIAKVPQNANPA